MAYTSLIVMVNRRVVEKRVSMTTPMDTMDSKICIDFGGRISHPILSNKTFKANERNPFPAPRVEMPQIKLIDLITNNTMNKLRNCSNQSPYCNEHHHLQTLFSMPFKEQFLILNESQMICCMA